jgi:hypothetical protein
VVSNGMLDAAALRPILDTFGRDEFGTVEHAKRLLERGGTLISPGRKPFPTSHVESLCRVRASHVHISRSLALQTQRVAETAASFPTEHWYLHRIENGGARIWIYVNEDGIGRACIDFEPKTD